MKIEVLEELGLSNAEVKVYLKLLELGKCKSGILIDKTKLQSSTVYHILGSLMEKGLVSYILNGKIKYYYAENPKILNELLAEKKKKLDELMPILLEKQNTSNKKQKAKIYEGFKGLKTAYLDILETMNKGEEYYFFQFPIEKLQDEKLTLFYRNYHIKRAEKGIFVKCISSTDTKESMKYLYNIKNTKIRLIEEPSPNVIVIYKGKVLIIDWDEEPIAFLIESNAIYSSYKKFFEHKWNQGIDM